MTDNIKLINSMDRYISNRLAETDEKLWGRFFFEWVEMESVATDGEHKEEIAELVSALRASIDQGGDE